MRGSCRVAIAALVFVAAPFAQSRAAEYRGAIAVSLTDDNLSWGWATNYPTQSRADRNAIAQCGHQNCAVVMRFWNGACAALATVDNSNGMGWGSAWRTSRGAAEAAALRACADNGAGSCRVAVSVCTARP